MHWIVLGGAYVILWFLALQVLLPIGISHAGDAELSVTGADPGAPARNHMLMKIAGATAIATVIWAAFYALVLTGVVDI